MLQTHRWRSGSRWRTHGNSDTPRHRTDCERWGQGPADARPDHAVASL